MAQRRFPRTPAIPCGRHTHLMAQDPHRPARCAGALAPGTSEARPAPRPDDLGPGWAELGESSVGHVYLLCDLRRVLCLLRNPGPFSVKQG